MRLFPRLRLSAVVALLLVLGLAACSTSRQVTRAYDAAQGERFAYTINNAGGMIDEHLAALRGELDRQLTAANALAGRGDADARAVTIRIDEYRMRHGAARALVGVMAGKDTVRSTVEVRDAAGAVLGSATIDSGNATAWGTSGGMLERHASEIVAFLRGQAAE